MAVVETKPNDVKALSILHKALAFGQIAFIIIASLLVYGHYFESKAQGEENIYGPVALILCLAGFFGGTALFNKKLTTIRSSIDNTSAKLAAYRAISISRWAFMEGPCLFAIIVFLLTASIYLLALAVVMIIVFLSLRPSTTKIALQLELDEMNITSL